MLHFMELKRDRGAITHDDRLDVLSMAVSYWSEQMAQDAEKKIKDRKEDLLDQELQKISDLYYGNKKNHRNSPNWI